MAKLLVPRESAKQGLDLCVRGGNDLLAKAKIAEKTARYDDWLDLLDIWREKTVTELDRLYAGGKIGRDFANFTKVTEQSSPRFTFPNAKMSLDVGMYNLQSLVDGLELAVGASSDATALESLHPAINSGCYKLYASKDYAEAVEKSFKIVRERLRELTGYETGSEAFGKGNLHIDGATASHVDEDFQDGVKFLTMAIDRFRNEKAHTADGNISDPIRAYEYLRLSSLAMHLLDRGRVRTRK